MADGRRRSEGVDEPGGDPTRLAHRLREGGEIGFLHVLELVVDLDVLHAHHVPADRC